MILETKWVRIFLLIIHRIEMFLKSLFIILTTSSLCRACDEPFEGFGVFLGQLKSFHWTNRSVIDQVLDLLYHDLGIRLFRTEILPEFSERPENIAIECHNDKSCAWIDVHYSFARFEGTKLFASIWSPPHYMKTNFSRLSLLRPKWKFRYYEFIKRVAFLAETEYSLNFEKISIVNEPDDIFAMWDHLNMSPMQLCNYLDDFNDPQLRICPETAWFFNMKLFMYFNSCKKVCDILAAHGYSPNLFEQNVHYNTQLNSHHFDRPIWMTEISGPFVQDGEPQMQEAIDLAISVINFVGYSCVSRYYYWLAFTRFPSGESLVWFDEKKSEIVLPKKYHAFKQFSRSSSFQGPVSAYSCSVPSDDYHCLRIGVHTIFVNDKNDPVPTSQHLKLCCTSELYDLECGHHSISLPPKSVCSSVFVDESWTFKLY